MDVQYIPPISEDDHPRIIDPLGQTYSVGDHVGYATTSGRSPVMKFGVVEKITHKGLRWQGHYVPDEPLSDGTPTNKWETYEADVFSVGIRCTEGARWAQGPGSSQLRYPCVDNIVRIDVRDH